MNINGRVKVKTLKAQFFDEFGLTIRVYDGRSFADDNATLASIRRGESIGGEFSPRKNTKVGNLEDKIKELFGLKTQIAGSDNSYLCDNNITLAKAKEDDDARMARKAKKADKVRDSGTEKTLGSIVIKEMSFKGELSNKVFNKILFWDESDALSDIQSFESTTDVYSVTFNSPALGRCDNIEELYEIETEFWQNIEEYKDKYRIEENPLWKLVTDSYCSMLVKNYTYKDSGEFEIKDIDLSEKIELFIKLLVNQELKPDDHPEKLGLTIGNSFVESNEPTEIDVELFNFDEGSECISLTDNTYLFPNRPATQEISINDFNINDICLLFSQGLSGFIDEDILGYFGDTNYCQELELELKDIHNYLKNKIENIDFNRIIKEKNIDFYEWVSSCNSSIPLQNFVKIFKIHKLMIEKDGKLFYFSSDQISVENAERKSIRDIISLISNDLIIINKITDIYETENDTNSDMFELHVIDNNFSGGCENTVKIYSVNGIDDDIHEFFDTFDEEYFSMLEHEGFYAEKDLPFFSNEPISGTISIEDVDTSDSNSSPKFEKVLSWNTVKNPSLLTVLNLSREYDNLIFTLDVDNLQRGIVAFIVISNGKILKCNKINIEANIIKLLDYNFNILSLSKGECLEDLGVGDIGVYCIDENKINDNEIEKKFNIKFQCESSSIFTVSIKNNNYISHSYHDDMDNDDETNTGYYNEMILHSQSSSFYSPDINSVTKDDHSFLIRLDGLSIDDIEDYEIELIDGIHPNGIKAIDVYKNTFDNFFASLSLTTGLIINGVILSKHGDNNCLYDYYTDLENYINVIDDLSYIRIFLFVTDTKDELTLDERFLEMEDYCFNVTFLNNSGLLVTQTYDRGEYDTGYYSSADEGDYVVDEEEFCNAKKFFNKN